MKRDYGASIKIRQPQGQRNEWRFSGVNVPCGTLISTMLDMYPEVNLLLLFRAQVPFTDVILAMCEVSSSIGLTIYWIDVLSSLLVHLSYSSAAAGTLLGPRFVHYRHMFRRTACETKCGMYGSQKQQLEFEQFWKLHSNMQLEVLDEFPGYKEKIENARYENVCLRKPR